MAIYSYWTNGKEPIICGGPLCDEYKLHCLRFRWGPKDDEGSEHMIDTRRYALELQATFNRRACKYKNKSESQKTCDVMIIAYVIEVPCQNHDFPTF